jgi:phage terminase large subunit-like protein
MLVADGEHGSEVEMVANSAKQAKICFDMSSNFLQSVDRKGKYFKRYRDKIKFDYTKSFLQVLSSDASGNDGYNSNCFILDECHEQPDSRLWDVMCSSQGMRQNPLAIIITTAGFNLYGFCY